MSKPISPGDSPIVPGPAPLTVGQLRHHLTLLPDDAEVTVAVGSPAGKMIQGFVELYPKRPWLVQVYSAVRDNKPPMLILEA